MTRLIRRAWQHLALAALLVASLAASAAAGPAALGRYGADPAKVTVSGISSGGYMAVQLGVAYSSTFSGVGVVAAGPYGCAYTEAGSAANVYRALGPCMAGGYSWAQKWQCWVFLAACPGKDGPNPQASIALAKKTDARGAIDALTNLVRQRVFIVSGGKDHVVDARVVSALEMFYAAMVGKDHVKHDVLPEAAHTFPTDDFERGNKCSASAAPYVSDCDYDAARNLLSFLYGALRPRNDGAPLGALIEFDQKRFFPPGADPLMADTGYVYVPKRCAAAAGCALHVALHGCRQTVADVGHAFVSGTGYNRWADTNGIVVLYPQVRKAGPGSGNPENCWDWWGYTGARWYEKRAPQMATIVAMVRQIAAK